MNTDRAPHSPPQPRTGLARALSKLGYCSRRQAWELIRARRVKLNGSVCADPETRVQLGRDRILVDEQTVRAAAKVYLMLNKPRGLVTTAADEQGRETVFRCFAGHEFPFLAPVGRLDKASEGLLLFSNDSAWAARITDPAAGVQKQYHVQIDCRADEALLNQLRAGVQVDGDLLTTRSISILREGPRNSWLEIALEGGKNRHIRRMLAAVGADVLRLVRVSIGTLIMGNLGKGQFRHLTAPEIKSLSSAVHRHQVP